MQGGSWLEIPGGSEKDLLIPRPDSEKEFRKRSLWRSDDSKLTRVSEELQSELIKDIISLQKERKDLLDFITPSHSHWKLKQIDGGEDKSRTWSGRKQEYISESTASASFQQHDNKGLASIFDVILEDMQDLAHRMLSMAHVMDKSGPSLPVRKANELASSTSRTQCILEEFASRTRKNNMQEQGQEVERQGQEGEIDDFLAFCGDYMKYDNELVLNLEQEKEREEEREEEEKKKEKEEEEKENENEKVDDTSSMEFLKIIMDFRNEGFSDHRDCWERVWGGDSGRCGGFNDATTLSSMQFTHFRPDTISLSDATAGRTLQIYSIRIKQLSGKLNWPLKVSGVVAVRDTVDHNRNILFSRSPRNYQLLTEKDPLLSLTGPSRAIYAVHPVDFEVDLEINEGAESISLHKYYSAAGGDLLFNGLSCMVELSIKQFDTPLQATIVGVRVVKGSWPFENGCRVVCPEVDGTQTPSEFVILDYHGKVMPVGTDGYLHLTRNVVSVHPDGPLRVDIEAYSESGSIAQRGSVDFPIQNCQTSKREFKVGNSELEIVVAWSLVVRDKLDLLVNCP